MKAKGKANTFALIKFALFSFLLALPSYANSDRSSEVLKAVWVYKFLSYIEWPNEKEMKTITISYWGGNEAFYQNLLALNNKVIRLSKIKIIRQRGMTPETNVQVIVLGQGNNKSLTRLQRKVAGQNTLIISDSAKDKQNIMINFVYPDPNSISFELNRYNIIYEKLALSSEILVIGGTEIDIAKVLNEMNGKLEETQKKLDKRESTLKSLSSSIDSKEDEMLTLQKKIFKQNQDIADTERKFTQLKQESNHLVTTLESSYEELTKSYEELAKNNTLLDEKQKSLNEKEKNIDKLSIAITKNTATLAEQQIHIEKQKQTLANQEISLVTKEKELLNKSSTIQRQNTVMLVSLVIILLVLSIVFILFKNSQHKKKSYEIMSLKNIELAQSNEQLVNTQSQLVESEKMAALGNLVAGVAHEINTPIGVSVTAISACQDLLEVFTKKVGNNNITRADMSTFLSKLKEATGLINNNLIRANDLIRQFKLVAVDQSSEEKREFLLNEYLNEVLASLYPQYKKFKCDVKISCNPTMTLYSYPGAVAQIVTNLVVNSGIHGFNVDEKASINIDVTEDSGHVVIKYQDNGSGIALEKQAKVFTPFYTTRRGQGGSGLGLHICYNIASKLGGDIKCIPCETGAKFVLTILKKL